MEPPTDLFNDLASLAAALDEPADLNAHLRHVIAALVDAVPTLIALTITVSDGNYPFVVGLAPGVDHTDVRATIHITFPHAAGGSSTELLAYASAPAAFADLRGDAVHGLGLHPDAVVTDAHLDVPPKSGSTLDEVSTINQAVGILIDLGYTPSVARAKLRHDAVLAGQALYPWARALLTAVRIMGDSRGDGFAG